ncbi:histidine phosphatase family protein [Deinococcus maricopensis]|uniref:Phosphoglycerate mutase n=1 Tax=Deinococcus maricopensis (strain DSM 21211 / LMG 22137 / NRRL B-23946 / LB-34) TaxID=709986 RepID=E8U6R5_DEIML|nr:histidine phosphatase family protein [Deinococcus maricopensis]ADV66754.1 Phosphoglycerate mutase [Deinococcus maricopensis DSM 21211]
MTRTRHLIKHARPAPTPGVPAHHWPAHPHGLTGVPTLAARLNPTPGVVIRSEELKAEQTAAALARTLGVPARRMLGLHEHLRYTVPCGTQTDFDARVAEFFAQPTRCVMGEESADLARARYHAAVTATMGAHPHPCVAVVAHGTVIRLLAAHLTGQNAHPLWRHLDFLGHLTVPWPT